MNWDRVEGQWRQLKGQAQQRWGRLTDDDWDVIDGKREELIGRVQKAYGKQRDEVERDVVVGLHGHERAERLRLTKAEDLGEELRGRLLVVRPHDGVVQLDGHGASSIDLLTP